MRASLATTPLLRVVLAAWPLAAFWLAGCTWGELSLAGKRCDPQRPCPEGLVCVELPDSATTRVGRCYAPADAPVCEPGELACAAAGGWIEVCEPDAHSRRVELECNSDQICNPDSTACALPCGSDSDCEIASTCDLATGLCRTAADCLPAACAGSCLDTICLPQAPADVSSPVGQPELDCFLQPPPALPANPALCELTGRVNLFPAKNNSDEAIGLQLKLLDAAYPHAVIQQATVEQGADLAGYYSFADVQTNRRYVVEVSAGTSVTGEQVVTTLNPGLDLRADLCVGALATFGLSAMRRSTFETYTIGTLAGLDPDRSLVIGRAQDCNTDSRRPLGQVTVGLSIGPVSPGRVYYFVDEDYLIPDLELGATSNSGYYAAAGVPACANELAFGARQGPTGLVLGRVEFFGLPGAAVIVDLPLPQQRLP